MELPEVVTNTRQHHIITVAAWLHDVRETAFSQREIALMLDIRLYRVNQAIHFLLNNNLVLVNSDPWFRYPTWRTRWIGTDTTIANEKNQLPKNTKIERGINDRRTTVEVPNASSES